jgi:hypothetical protein
MYFDSHATVRYYISVVGSWYCRSCWCVKAFFRGPRWNRLWGELGMMASNHHNLSFNSSTVRDQDHGRSIGSLKYNICNLNMFTVIFKPLHKCTHSAVSVCYIALHWAGTFHNTRLLHYHTIQTCKCICAVPSLTMDQRIDGLPWVAEHG